MLQIVNFCKIMKDRWFISHALIVFLRCQFDKPFEIKQIKDKRDSHSMHARFLCINLFMHARSATKVKKQIFFFFSFQSLKKDSYFVRILILFDKK